MVRFLFILIFVYLQSNYLFSEKALVNVKSNLVLRAKPDKKAQKLDTIPAKTILDTQNTEEDSELNRWYQVTYNGKTGWVHGEFLDFNLGNAKKETAVGVFLGVEQGDYFHISFKINSVERSFFVIKYLGKIYDEIEKNPEKMKGKKMKITWMTEKIYIPEAGGFNTIDNLKKLEPVN